MARDYAKKTRPRRQTQSRSRARPARRAAPGWAWAVAGLAAGLFIAFLVYLNEHRPGRAGGARPAALALPAAAAGKPAAPAAKTEAKPQPRRPRFDFYTILPEQEVVVPDHAPDDERTAPAANRKPAVYLLQAGSFRTLDQADSLRARLALLGVEATIETVKLSDTDIWHRVRIGPFHSSREVDRIQQRLRSHDNNTLLMKIKG